MLHHFCEDNSENTPHGIPHIDLPSGWWRTTFLAPQQELFSSYLSAAVAELLLLFEMFNSRVIILHKWRGLHFSPDGGGLQCFSATSVNKSLYVNSVWMWKPAGWRKLCPQTEAQTLKAARDMIWWINRFTDNWHRTSSDLLWLIFALFFLEIFLKQRLILM